MANILMLTKMNEFPSSGVTLWGPHKLAGKELTSKSTTVPRILMIVLVRIELEKFSIATGLVKRCNP